MEAPSTFAVRLERRIAAPREAVFRAWTEAATLVKWFGPADGMPVQVLEMDARPGGRLWVDMVSPDGASHQLRCTFEEVIAPERVVLRWAWASSPGSGVSRVTVSLTESGGATELVLVHEALPSTTARDSHTRGWNGSLPRLEKMFA